DSIRAATNAAEGSILLYSKNEKLAASRFKAAGGGQDRAQRGLIASDACDEKSRQSIAESGPQLAHHVQPPSFASRRAACCTRYESARINPHRGGPSDWREINTRSRPPGISCRVRQTASL